MAVSLPTKQHSSSLSARADLLGTGRNGLSDGRKRWENWVACCNGEHGDDCQHFLSVVRATARKDKTPQEWLDWVPLAWLSEKVTRPSAYEVLRNPSDRSDKAKYPIHYLDTKIVTAVSTINDLGKIQFGSGFALSYRISLCFLKTRR